LAESPTYVGLGGTIVNAFGRVRTSIQTGRTPRGLADVGARRRL